jgi:protein phosphatase 1 regulatory subunit 11
MQRDRDAISGSQIVTASATPERTSSEAANGEPTGESSTSEAPVLRLRLLGGDINRPRVAWDEKVIDNEHLGRKSSKSMFIPIYRSLMSSLLT